MSNSLSQLVNVKTHFSKDVNDCDNYIGIWIVQLITETMNQQRDFLIMALV